jgi:hypothetical protein
VELGFSESSTGLITSWVLVLDTEPSGFFTVILMRPELDVSVAGTVASSRLSLTKVVGRAVDSQYTVEPLTKPLPSTSGVRSVIPAVARVLANTPVIVGAADATPIKIIRWPSIKCFTEPVW